MKNTIRLKALFMVLILLISVLSACGSSGTKNTPTPSINANSPTPNATGGPTTSPGQGDVNTTASIVNEAGAFEKAISNNGTWIICLLNDLTINKDLVLDGEFKNGKKDDAGMDIIQRKIALYTQDDNRKVTNRFTLTAPKLTINSPKARIQSGTFKGDIYVTAKDFELVDATVEGNLYFTNTDAESSFKMDATSKVTGKKELKK